MKIFDLTIDETGEMGTFAISLVEKPAIEKEWIALKEDTVKLQSVDKERRMVYGAALIPGKPIYRVRPNGEEYYIRFSKEVIERTAHDFYERNNHHNATLEHDSEVEGVVYVESWIKESDNDKSVALGIDAPVGTWFVGGKVKNDDLWGKIKLGEVKGFSIEGIYSEALADEILLKSLVDEIEKVVNQL